jgi:hypothetical protein
MKDTIEMARKAGLSVKDPQWGYTESHHVAGWLDNLKAFEALVRADEQKKWQEQTAVEIHEAALDEREACAKVCFEWSDYTKGIAPTLAERIRARANT